MRQRLVWMKACESLWNVYCWMMELLSVSHSDCWWAYSSFWVICMNEGYSCLSACVWLREFSEDRLREHTMLECISKQKSMSEQRLHKNIYVGCIDFLYINMPCVKGNCHPANDCMIHPLWCIEWREVWILSYVVLLAWLGSINYLVWMRWEGNWITWECVSTYVNGIVAFNSKCPWKEGVNEAQIIY